MTGTALLYGVPKPGLVDVDASAIQVSPLAPGSADLTDWADGAVDSITVMAPGGTVERDYVLAQALRVLRPGGSLLAVAPKDKGGARLKKALEAFGCTVVDEARRHHRFCRTTRPVAPEGLASAIAAGGPQMLATLGVWSQPGVFSWDRLDPGSAQLLAHLPPLTGRGADLGCGIGLLSHKVLASPGVTDLIGVDIDGRAIACARRNLDDPRVTLRWADVRRLSEPPSNLDFVVMNPPFHDTGVEDRDLGVAFVRAAAAMLRKGGSCWLVANRHLPYEAALAEAFSRVQVKSETSGYKVVEARR